MQPDAITFDVIGMDPATQGSKKAMPNGILLETNKRLRPWRSLIADAALSTAAPLTQSPVSVSITFRFLRPRSHFTRSGTLTKSAPRLLTSKQRGDIDKLSRAVLDALTGTLLHDDAQVVQLSAHKRYTCPGEHPGALITVIPLAAT